MKGIVRTPADLADHMTQLLFEHDPPTEDSTILFPGVGEGPFIEAVERYCSNSTCSFPEGYACDTHPERLDTAHNQFSHLPITFENTDFLSPELDLESFDYILGNPPYVPITNIDEETKTRYRSEYETATQRFDLYILFFERALDLLDESGRLCFVTPEKFEYVETARPLRKLIQQYHLKRLEHRPQSEFSGKTTYPTISLIHNRPGDATTVVSLDGNQKEVSLPANGDRWTPYVRDVESSLEESGITLGGITQRISPGMATGADNIYVFDKDDLPTNLDHLACDTISGKQLEQEPLEEQVTAKSVFICPYDDQGNLYSESELGAFADWARKQWEERLRNRSCVTKDSKQWYAWHENPPMQDLLQEKILFRDLTKNPAFWLDKEGTIIPRHTVYYAVPDPDVDIEKLRAFLNSAPVKSWLHANCQAARNGYLRLQSRVLEELPIPREINSEIRKTLTSHT